MTRWEAAIDTPLAFREGGLLSSHATEAVGIEFDGCRYVWHDGARDGERPCWPVVTVMVSGMADTSIVENGISRLLSALSFRYDLPMAIDSTAGTGWKKEFDRPFIGQPGFGTRQLESAPQRVEVPEDDRLRLTLALAREARSARSPAYRFLAYYNALDAAFDDDQDARTRFIAKQLREAEVPSNVDSTTFEWSRYLREVLRNAVAHAIRPEGRPMLDPDATSDRRALTAGASHLAGLVRSRVATRWPDPVRVHPSR